MPEENNCLWSHHDRSKSFSRLLLTHHVDFLLLIKKVEKLIRFTCFCLSVRQISRLTVQTTVFLACVFLIYMSRESCCSVFNQSRRSFCQRSPLPRPTLCEGSSRREAQSQVAHNQIAAGFDPQVTAAGKVDTFKAHSDTSRHKMKAICKKASLRTMLHKSGYRER